jgi:hypothetical protein
MTLNSRPPRSYARTRRRLAGTSAIRKSIPARKKFAAGKMSLDRHSRPAILELEPRAPGRRFLYENSLHPRPF